MNLTPVVARITAECPSFKLVGGAADFGGIEGVPRATPACFILPLAESGEADEGLDEPDFVQRVRAEFGVVVAVTNVASRAGAEGAAALEDLRAELVARNRAATKSMYAGASLSGRRPTNVHWIRIEQLHVCSHARRT